MSAVLWQWPERARIGRAVPKSKFYEHAKVTSKLRAAFVDEVERITWAYKLSPETLAIPGAPEVEEIQVFHLEAKPEREVSETVLIAVDKAIHTPVIFEELRTHGSADSQFPAGVRTRAAFKRPGLRGPILSVPLAGDWVELGTARWNLPSALDLMTLYVGLLKPLMPVERRPGEALSEAFDRIERVRAVEREVASLERRLKAEPQLNRKVEIRRALLARISEYEALADPLGDSRA
jgi:hypothetical protein